MPDAFGMETPQEALARVQNQFAQQRHRFNNSNMSNSPGAQAGQALGNIFGGAIRKTLDTRSARKSEAQRLVEETGMSVQEARETAKEQVPRDFAEVRRAKNMEAAAGNARRTYDETVGRLGHVRAQAAADTVMAAQLRRQGFHTEATALSERSAKALQAEEVRMLGVRQLKADVSRTELLNEESELSIEQFGDQPIEHLSNEREKIIAEIETTDDAGEIPILERRLGVIEGRIAKLNNISLSDADERALSDSALSKELADLVDLTGEVKELEMLENIIFEHKGELASTRFGQLGAKAAGLAEVWFGLDPESIGADTLIGDVQEIQGSAAFVSAAIRHSLTGAAMSPAEAVFLQPFLATPGEPLSVMLGKVRVIKSFKEMHVEHRRQLLLDEGARSRWLDRANRMVEATPDPAKGRPSVVTPATSSVTDSARTSQQILAEAAEKRAAKLAEADK